jgi:transposase
MDKKDVIIDKLTEANRLLRERIRVLEEEIARLKKDSSNSSKPPSSDIVKPPKTGRRLFRKKRKKGGQPGHPRATRRPFEPEQVDEAVEYELTAQAAQGLKPLQDWFILQQIMLPEKMVKIIEHRARKYLDPLTGNVVIAPLPDDIRRGGLLGADITTWVAFLKGACHMSYTTIQRFFKELLGLDLSCGLLCKAVQKTSAALQPTYDALADRLPAEARVNVDETGHHDDGVLHWTWCFDTSDYSLFKIDKSRGSEVLVDVLGDSFTGVIGSDFWGAYRKYARLFGVRMQYCMAHLIRELRFLADHPVQNVSRWGQDLLARLKKLFDTLHRRETLTAGGFLRSMERIKAAFLRDVRRPPDHKPAQKLARRFEKDAAEEYFRFLTDPEMEPTNNQAERQIRPVVIDRRITQGTRGASGMRWCERIWTTLATCKKQGRNVFDFIHQSVVAHWSSKNYPSLIREIP